MFFDEHGRFKKNVVGNPNFEVVLEGKCPIPRAEEEIEITNVVNASGEIIKKRKMDFSKEEECAILGKHAHRRVHQHSAKSTIKTVSKGLWFP